MQPHGSNDIFDRPNTGSVAQPVTKLQLLSRKSEDASPWETILDLLRATLALVVTHVIILRYSRLLEEFVG